MSRQESRESRPDDTNTCATPEVPERGGSRGGVVVCLVCHVRGRRCKSRLWRRPKLSLFYSSSSPPSRPLFLSVMSGCMFSCFMPRYGADIVLSSPVFESRPPVPADPARGLLARPQSTSIPTFDVVVTYSPPVTGPLQPESTMDGRHAPHLLGVLPGPALRHHVLRLVRPALLDACHPRL